MMNDIEYLNSTVFATLQRSFVHGVGVFAIREIKKGQRITDHSVHDFNRRVFNLREEEFELLDPAVRKLILDRTTFIEGQETFRFISPNSEQTLQSFMNHSAHPNFLNGVALCDIHPGEEIVEDFRRLNGKPMHRLSAEHYSFL